MKKSLLIILFIAFTSTIQSQTILFWRQIEKAHLGNETTYKLRYSFDPRDPNKENHLLDGSYKIGDESGAYTLAKFNKGKVIGVWQEYNSDEKLILQANYSNGKKEGDYIEYLPNGDVKNKEFYKEGKQDGKQEGEVEVPGHAKCRYKSYFKNGKPTGSWKTTCNNQVVISKEYKSEDKYTEKIFFKNKQLKIFKNYKNAKLDGKYQQFDIDGILLKDYLFKEGTPIVKKQFYGNGKLKSIEHRNINNEKHGEYLEYTKINKLHKKGTYQNNNRHGKWKFYYNNGDVREVFTFKNDKKTGDYTLYYKGNIIKLKGEFFKNNKTGVWKNYSITGKLIKETTYENGIKISVKEIKD